MDVENAVEQLIGACERRLLEISLDSLRADGHNRSLANKLLVGVHATSQPNNSTHDSLLLLLSSHLDSVFVLCFLTLFLSIFAFFFFAENVS
jgi:hypothetical protein